jgi:hypothetical protein
MRFRSVVCVGAALAAATVTVPVHLLRAAPPTASVMAVALPTSAPWITHEIIGGENLNEIADRYAVSVASILRWNKLDPNRPQFWVGEQLRIQTQLPDRVRHRIDYIVRPNDAWEALAQRFSVDPQALQKFWNPSELKLQPGHQLSIWVETGTVDSDPPALPSFTLPEIAPGAVSIGWPDSGRLSHGVQIPENPQLYTLRNLDHAWGSTHAIGVLQSAVADFRTRTGFDREVVIWDMSMQRGGRYGPHHSHRTGRDVDIALLLNPGFELGSGKRDAVDWEATWHLIHAFVASGQVRYVFLSRTRQLPLYRAAKACGATPEELERIIQYPRTERVGIVRHAPGHTGHIHVRFLCGEDETACQEI